MECRVCEKGRSFCDCVRSAGYHRLYARDVLPERGAAKPAIPVLRKVYLEPGMQEVADAAIKAIDPDAKVTQLDTELDLDLDL